MGRTYILIRTCQRDDYLSRLCYESFKQAGVDGTYIYLAEEGEYKWSTGVKIYRPFCDNFGGQIGIKNLFAVLKTFSFADDDIVIISDADIVMFDNPLDYIEDFDYAGYIGDEKKYFPRISGQLQIIKGWMLNRVLSENPDSIVRELELLEVSVADDTAISYCAHRYEAKVVKVRTWVHDKFYKYTGRHDFKTVINEIRNER